MRIVGSEVRTNCDEGDLLDVDGRILQAGF